tara:strand:+ start:417 stop:1862 length:1446 start_codon:yes stop_codon:yes gene_type:complete
MSDKVVINAEINGNVGELSKDISKAADQTERLEKGTKKGTTGFKKLGSVVKGVGSAIKKAGLAILVGLLVKLGDTLRKNQTVLDGFNVAMEALSIAFNDLFQYLEDNVGSIKGWFKDIFEDPESSVKNLGDAIKENLQERLESIVRLQGLLALGLFELMQGRFKNAWHIVKTMGKESVDVLTGVNDTVDKTGEIIEETTKKIKDYGKEVLKTAKENVELNKAAELAAVINQRIIEQKDREAEAERMLRDDITKTMDVRIAASEKLTTILDEQEKAMLKNTQAIVDAAQAQYDLNDSDANYMVLIQAKTEKDAVLAQIQGFRTEQLMSHNALLEEQQALIKADKEATLAAQQEKMAAYSGLLGGLKELAGENKALAVAQAIIDTYAGANKAIAQGGTLGPIIAAGVIASGLANVRKILSTDVGDGGGGDVGAEPELPAPEMIGGKFEMTGINAPEPMKAYVVTDEMTNSQDQLANIRRRATI